MQHLPKNEAARSDDGDRQLVRGERAALRLWEAEAPGTDKPERSSPYDTLGYVIAGRAELSAGGQTVTLAPGDSYLVPAGEGHTYRILEAFTAVEATTPPAEG